MASKRFREERYALDQRVEFRNGRHWHPAVVTGAVAIDGTGCQYYPLRATATAGVIQEGQHLRGYPGDSSIRWTTRRRQAPTIPSHPSSAR
jgi:hypothetical protein